MAQGQLQVQLSLTGICSIHLFYICLELGSTIAYNRTGSQELREQQLPQPFLLGKSTRLCSEIVRPSRLERQTWVEIEPEPE